MLLLEARKANQAASPEPPNSRLRISGGADTGLYK